MLQFLRAYSSIFFSVFMHIAHSSILFIILFTASLELSRKWKYTLFLNKISIFLVVSLSLFLHLFLTSWSSANVCACVFYFLWNCLLSAICSSQSNSYIYNFRRKFFLCNNWSYTFSASMFYVKWPRQFGRVSYGRYLKRRNKIVINI